MSDIIYKCRACGAVIELEAKFCTKCGAVNVIRLRKIAKLELKRSRVDKRREKIWKHASRRKSIRGDRAAEFWDKSLATRSRNLRMKQAKLKTGSTHEGKLRWIKTQLYDLKRSIQDIADDLGESMITVAKYLEEIEN